MENYNIKQKLSEEKGITLVALIITVMVMTVIVAVTADIGTDSLDNTRLQAFYTQLEIIQKRADDIVVTNENYIDSNGNKVYLKEQGTAYDDLTTEQKNNLKNIIATELAGSALSASTFRYFTVEQLKDLLDLTEMEYNVFIDFDSRTIIAEDGIIADGEIYYVLKNKIYYVEQNTTKNEGEITSLSYTISEYGTNKYKIIVKPSNTIGDLKAEGTLRYKKITTKYWEISNNMEIIIDELTQYNIEYTDKNKNTISQTITVFLDEDDNLTYTVNK